MRESLHKAYLQEAPVSGLIAEGVFDSIKYSNNNAGLRVVRNCVRGKWSLNIAANFRSKKLIQIIVNRLLLRIFLKTNNYFLIQRML